MSPGRLLWNRLIIRTTARTVRLLCLGHDALGDRCMDFLGVFRRNGTRICQDEEHVVLLSEAGCYALRRPVRIDMDAVDCLDASRGL